LIGFKACGMAGHRTMLAVRESQGQIRFAARGTVADHFQRLPKQRVGCIGHRDASHSFKLWGILLCLLTRSWPAQALTGFFIMPPCWSSLAPASALRGGSSSNRRCLSLNKGLREFGREWLFARGPLWPFAMHVIVRDLTREALDREIDPDVQYLYWTFAKTIEKV
jgi:hypothetical protein